MNNDSILFVITIDYNIFKLHFFLEHNDFATKPIIKIIHVILIFPTSDKFKENSKSKNSSHQKLKCTLFSLEYLIFSSKD